MDVRFTIYDQDVVLVNFYCWDGTFFKVFKAFFDGFGGVVGSGSELATTFFTVCFGVVAGVNGLAVATYFPSCEPNKRCLFAYLNEYWKCYAVVSGDEGVEGLSLFDASGDSVKEDFFSGGKIFDKVCDYFHDDIIGNQISGFKD